MKKRRFRIHLNIGTLMFGMLLVYLLITLLLFITKKRVDTYQVIQGNLSGNDTFTALILRDEDIVQSTADGYVNYLVSSSEKVSKSDVICAVSAQPGMSTNAVIDTSDYKQLRKLASAASGNFDPVKFEAIYDLQYSLSNVIWDEETVAASAGNFYSANSDGIVSMYVDGYEYMQESDLTTDLGQNEEYHAVRLQNQAQVSAGSSLYRMVNGEEWTLYFALTDAQTVKLSAYSGSKIEVEFASDGNTESGVLTFLKVGDQRYGKITLSSGLYRYVDERFIDFEIVSSNQDGLKIPASSVVSKDFYTIPSSYLTYSDDDAGFLRQVKTEDGTNGTEFVSATVYAHTTSDNESEDLYYVDMSALEEGDILIKPDSNEKYTVKATSALEGAYCVNKGYCVFRRIQILDRDSDFCIVARDTSYGLSLHDFIIADGSTVSENEVIA